MTSLRKLKCLNKRNYHTNDGSPEKDGSNSSRCNHRKKLSDRLGPQWMKDELQIFYDSYRKYGHDWKKVAAAVSNRSVDMVESLFNMNKAYLSLPEGTASVVGLIAMMTDHYNVLGGSDSEQDNEDDLDSRKSQKRKRKKVPLSTSDDDPSISLSVYSGGCLSTLKSRPFDVKWPRVVGKRTPRVPVSYLRDKECYDSPCKKSQKSEGDANYDEVARIAALTLTEAYQRKRTSQVPELPYGREKSTTASPAQNRKHAQSGKRRAKLHCSSIDEEFWEDNKRILDASKEENAKGSTSSKNMEGGTVEIHHRRKKTSGKEKNEFDDESLNYGAAEGISIRPATGKVDTEVLDLQSDQLSLSCRRKKSKKDQNPGLNALQTLADLSLLMPTSTIKADYSVKAKEESTTSFQEKNKTKVPEHASGSQKEVRLPGAKKKSLVSFSGFEDTNEKSKPRRESTIGAASDANEKIQVFDKRKSFVSKVKLQGPDNCCALLKIEVKSEVDGTSSNKVADEHTLPVNQGRRSKCKMDLQKKLSSKELKLSDKQLKKLHNKYSTSMEDKALSLKEKLSYCLSSSTVRKWCTFEWIYSAIDYPWFAKKDFVEYLDHVGLEEIPRLTRIEWSVIRSSLGKPKRFSEHFLHKERDKLKCYRESVRKHYSELRNGVKEGLPSDLARPLSVGQRVIALHPKTREVHEGCILTVDHDKCRVQFDCPEIGVEFFMDIDCMPVNPLDNVPEALRNQTVAMNKLSCNNKELERNGHLIVGGFKVSVSNRHSETTSSYNSTNWLIKQGDANNTVSLGNLTSDNMVRAQLASFRQPCMTKHNQAKEDDYQVYSEKTILPDEKYNPHHGNPLLTWLKLQGSSKLIGNSPYVFQESGCSVGTIVQGSRQKAQRMVKAAIKALSSRKEGEDRFTRIREALNSLSDQQLTSEEHLFDSLGDSISDCLGTTDVACQGPDKNDSLIPSELITSCIATLLMIQTCTERQYPPADVARILDCAVTSLHPCCSQNQPIYGEIQTYMGRIKTQILALVPT